VRCPKEGNGGVGIPKSDDQGRGRPEFHLAIHHGEAKNEEMLRRLKSLILKTSGRARRTGGFLASGGVRLKPVSQMQT